MASTAMPPRLMDVIVIAEYTECTRTHISRANAVLGTQHLSVLCALIAVDLRSSFRGQQNVFGRACGPHTFGVS